MARPSAWRTWRSTSGTPRRRSKSLSTIEQTPTLIFVRETIWNATQLGEAWALHGDLDNACQCLTDALRRSIATEDRRGLLAIAGVRRRIGRWADDPLYSTSMRSFESKESLYEIPKATRNR